MVTIDHLVGHNRALCSDESTERGARGALSQSARVSVRSTPFRLV